MKAQIYAAAALLQASLALGRPYKQSAENGSVYPVGFSNDPFAKTVGTLFDIDGTGPRYFAGTNAWWLTHLLSNDDVDAALDTIKEVRFDCVFSFIGIIHFLQFALGVEKLTIFRRIISK
jgi:hypothetical protein